MKFEMTVQRIVLARESQATFLFPYENFQHKVKNAGALLDYLEGKKASREIQHEARKYFVITCVSAMENYFARTAQIFVQGGWINDNFLSVLKEDKISLADLLEINRKNLRLSEIFMVSHSFQNLDAINHIYTKMLGVNDFVKEVEIFDSKMDDGKHIILNKDFPDFRKKISELAKLRHLIVHHEGFKGILGRERLYKMTLNLTYFVAAADAYVMDKVPAD